MTDQGLILNSILRFSLPNNGTQIFTARLFGELRRGNRMHWLISIPPFFFFLLREDDLTAYVGHIVLIWLAIPFLNAL